MEQAQSGIHTQPAANIPIPIMPIRGDMKQEDARTMHTMPEAAEPCGFCITPAMAYVPMQKWVQLYEAEVGFTRGTIFPQLDLPFLQ